MSQYIYAGGKHLSNALSTATGYALTAECIAYTHRVYALPQGIRNGYTCCRLEEQLSSNASLGAVVVVVVVRLVGSGALVATLQPGELLYVPPFW